jgi:hypothetical protein
MAEHRFVEGGHQRRALPARGHVAAPEIGHDIDRRELGQARGVVQLDGEAEVRAVAHGLPVAADGGDRFTRDTARGERAFDRARVELRQLERDRARELERVRAGLAQREDAIAQRRGEGDRRECKGARAGAREIDQGRVGAVEAGSRHQPHEESGHGYSKRAGVAALTSSRVARASAATRANSPRSRAATGSALGSATRSGSW